MKNKVTKLVILLSLAALALFTQQQDAMVILPNGNVGINTETPEHRLEVEGDMAVTEDLIVGGNITAANFIVAPVGSIIAFHPNITTPPLEIPEGWLACDGSVVSDENSPLNGFTLPDLNREVYAGGRGFYLRGGNESGGGMSLRIGRIMEYGIPVMEVEYIMVLVMPKYMTLIMIVKTWLPIVVVAV